MTRIKQGDLCLEKAYKAILGDFSLNGETTPTTTLQQFKSYEVRAMLART